MTTQPVLRLPGKKKELLTQLLQTSVCVAVDGSSLTSATNSRTPAEALPQVCALAEHISLCSIGDNLHVLQT